MNKTLLIAGTLFILSGCFASKLAEPTQADADRMKSTYPELSLTELNEGKTLFVQHCQTCHALKNPKSKTAEQWKTIVPLMVGKVNKKGQVLDITQQNSILKFVVTMAKQ